MIKRFLLPVVLVAILGLSWCGAVAQDSVPIGTATKIWDAAPHNAFTDLVRFHDRWYCVFREGQGHVSPDGALRVITSVDGETWESAALITSENSDLRDAKITVTPDGELMLCGAEALHDKSQHTHQSLAWFSKDGRNWSEKHAIGDPDFWLWRVTWHEDKAYGIGYGCREDKSIRLYSSQDGKNFETLVERLHDVGYPNETSIVFSGNTAYCLLRRDGRANEPNTGLLGISQAPFTDWKWKDLGTRIGGPHMIRLPDGRFVAAVRLYDKQVRTSLCWIDTQAGKLTEFLALPSGGDTSYAGLVLHEDQLWVSYYSSHEGKTNIYLSKTPVPSMPREVGSRREPASTHQLVSAEAKRPNILFILVDDQSPFDLKCYNPESILETPNIDRLAREGMVFDGAYHMGANIGAVCSPSRHMIMSGRTVWHLPTAPLAVQKGLCPPNLEQHTIPAVFNRAGYATMRTCKQGNSYEAANKLFTVRHDATKRGGTHESGSAWHGDRVMDYLAERESTNDTKPFLIYFGFSHPHDERDGTPELLAKYGAVNHTDKDNPPPAQPNQPKLPPNYLSSHPFHHGHPGLRDEVDVSGVWQRRDEQTIRNEIGRQFACSENIDIQIGRVLEKLERMGELDNTYIVYTSDHGMAIGRHGLQGKQNLYQHTWRVPFIVSGPGIKPGSRVEGNIYLLDTLATLCDLAGIDTPETNEGISFKPVLTGEQQTVRDVMFGVYNGGTKPGMRSVKKGDWKLIKYDVINGSVRETQLFHLKDNPQEFLAEHHSPDVIALTGVKPEKHQVNLAADPKYAEKLEEMEALLLAEMRRLNDPWRLWNQPDDGITPPAEGAPRGQRNGKKKQQ